MKITALLNEMNDSGQSKMNVPLDKDLIYKAKNMFPGYDSQQALTLYMARQVQDQEKTDSTQNKLIDTQKRENERLRSVIDNLGQELSDFEQQSAETDQEVQRLKQLSGNLKPTMQNTKQDAKAEADELEKLQQQVNALQAKPGLEPEKLKKFQEQVNKLMTNPNFGKVDVEQIEQLVTTLEKQSTVSDDLNSRLERKLIDTQKALDAKEGRFAKYIEKKKNELTTVQANQAAEMKKYADIVNGYKQEIGNFDEFMKQKAEEIINLVDYAKSHVGSPAATANQAITKAQTTSKAGPQGLDQQYAQSEKERSYSNIANPIAESIINELIRPAKDYGVKEYNDWLARDLPVLVKIFKNKYYRELENKHPTYGDQQIAYTCEEHAPYLWKIGQSEEPIITKKQMDIYLTAVKVDLFRQPVEQEQIDLFSENLDKIYESMLNSVIGLKYIK